MRFKFETASLVASPYWKRCTPIDYVVTDVSSLSNPKHSSLMFMTKVPSTLPSVQGCLVIVPDFSAVKETAFAETNLILESSNPRLSYAVLLQNIVAALPKATYKQVGGAFIATDAVVAEDVIIEPLVVVGQQSVIGKGTVLKAGVKIGSYVHIGDHCTIGENSVVGNWGFGVERAANGDSFRIPHLGGVRIGSFVHIGALNTVVAGTIEPTVVEDHVQTDDHVHIAHNCHIKRSVHLTACVELSGSVTIGENSVIGPNASVMNKISLGRNTVVGLGAVVTKSFGDDVTIAGNPADTIENVKAMRRICSELLEGSKKA